MRPLPCTANRPFAASWTAAARQRQCSSHICHSRTLHIGNAANLAVYRTRTGHTEEFPTARRPPSRTRARGPPGSTMSCRTRRGSPSSLASITAAAHNLGEIARDRVITDRKARRAIAIEERGAALGLWERVELLRVELLQVGRRELHGRRSAPWQASSQRLAGMGERGQLVARWRRASESFAAEGQVFPRRCASANCIISRTRVTSALPTHLVRTAGPREIARDRMPGLVKKSCQSARQKMMPATWHGIRGRTPPRLAPPPRSAGCGTARRGMNAPPNSPPSKTSAKDAKESKSDTKRLALRQVPGVQGVGEGPPTFHLGVLTASQTYINVYTYTTLAPSTGER